MVRAIHTARSRGHYPRQSRDRKRCGCARPIAFLHRRHFSSFARGTDLQMNGATRFAVLLALMWPHAAAAHAMLQHAEPGAGAIVHRSPAQVHLEFTEQLEPAFSDVVVTDEGGRSVANGAAAISGMAMTVKLNR